MLFDRSDMAITLCPSGFTCDGRRPRRNDDRGSRMTYGDSIVDGLAIISAVRRHRCNVGINLIE
jgi:hypothetical protein